MNGHITIKGSQIYYESIGDGDPMVFIHADGLDSRMWEQQVAHFSKNYRVIVYDIRGFGKSDIPSDQTYSFVEDLSLLLSHLNISKAHLVGLSQSSGLILAR